MTKINTAGVSSVKTATGPVIKLNTKAADQPEETVIEAIYSVHCKAAPADKASRKAFGERFKSANPKATFPVSQLSFWDQKWFGNLYQYKAVPCPPYGVSPAAVRKTITQHPVARPAARSGSLDGRVRTTPDAGVDSRTRAKPSRIKHPRRRVRTKRRAPARRRPAPTPRQDAGRGSIVL